MSHERRTFKRTGIALKGELLWQLRRRIGPAKTIRVDVVTLDLSVAGARVSTTMKASLPVGASVRLDLEGESSPARVRAVFPDPVNPKQHIVLLQFEEPSSGFLRVVDEWVDAARGGSAYKTEYWRNQETAAS